MATDETFKIGVCKNISIKNHKAVFQVMRGEFYGAAGAEWFIFYNIINIPTRMFHVKHFQMLNYLFGPETQTQTDVS